MNIIKFIKSTCNKYEFSTCFIFFEMGQQQSFGIQQENIGDLQEFITKKAFEEMKVDTSFRHLTISEKQLIDKTHDINLKSSEGNSAVDIQIERNLVLSLTYDTKADFRVTKMLLDAGAEPSSEYIKRLEKQVAERGNSTFTLDKEIVQNITVILEYLDTYLEHKSELQTRTTNVIQNFYEYEL